ncbi:hypothetical protein F5050DRAFT_156085 [Lentinula boryana]|uniref:Uncharacterized protein n=1 Tax=Lentinula boryana TaxID=40481 RepID=A0ABQ8QRM2_9AGAR|nr:hypothetical protein F5050DRAFT_156085 [Lentinula boryana]
MPHNGRNQQRRHRGNKDDDRSAYSREDDYYSRSRQSDHRYRENASVPGRHSYDVDAREVSPSSSRAVDSSWQRTEYGGGYQDRYSNKGRRDDYVAVAVLDSRETEVGWSTHRSTNDADLYSPHPQREEWTPPPRYDSNYPSTYQDQYQHQPPASSSFTQQQPWVDDTRHQDDRMQQDQHSHRQSSRGADSRWQREERVVYHQEPDNGWETRRSEQDQRQSWDENSVDRQWDQGHSWQSSQRGYDSSQQPSRRSQNYNQKNGRNRISSNRKNSRKNDSNGKVNGSNKNWIEEDDLNNWSKRERDIFDDRRNNKNTTRRKHSRSFSRSPSPAGSYYSHRSRRRTPSPPPQLRASTRPSPTYTHFESSPPPKRRRRDSSPRFRTPPPDFRPEFDRGQPRRPLSSPSSPPAEFRQPPPSPSSRLAENRSPVSPVSTHRRNDKSSFRRSVSPVARSARSHRNKSPTPVELGRVPSPQRRPDVDAAPPAPAPASPPPSASVDIPPPESKPLRATQEPAPPQQKSGKNKKVIFSSFVLCVISHFPVEKQEEKCTCCSSYTSRFERSACSCFAGSSGNSNDH